MKTLLIFATVLVAVRGQGPEGGEGSRYAPNAAAPSPGGGNYDPCKCQCVFPAKTYRCGFKTCGNCKSRDNELPMPAVTPGNLAVENSGLGKHALLQMLGHHNAHTNSDK